MIGNRKRKFICNFEAQIAQYIYFLNNRYITHSLESI